MYYRLLYDNGELSGLCDAETIKGFAMYMSKTGNIVALIKITPKQ